MVSSIMVKTLTIDLPSPERSCKRRPWFEITNNSRCSFFQFCGLQGSSRGKNQVLEEQVDWGKHFEGCKRLPLSIARKKIQGTEIWS